MHSATVHQYYNSWESRLGYRLLLKGTRHFGYYDYGKWWPFPLSAAQCAMEQRLFDMLNSPAGSRVLDAGCGNGQIPIFMARQGLQIEAIDIVDRHVERARENISAQNLKQKIQVTTMSYQKLGFKDEFFDGWYTMEALAHSPDLHMALTELYRVTKPGGQFALFGYEHDTLDNGRMGKAITFVNELSSMSGFQICTPGTHKKELEDVGFEVTEVHDFTENAAPMLRLFYILAWLPYMILGGLGLRRKFPNTAAAVEFWRHRNHIQYVALSGKKPLKQKNGLHFNES